MNHEPGYEPGKWGVLDSLSGLPEAAVHLDLVLLVVSRDVIGNEGLEASTESTLPSLQWTSWGAPGGIHSSVPYLEPVAYGNRGAMSQCPVEKQEGRHKLQPMFATQVMDTGSHYGIWKMLNLHVHPSCSLITQILTVERAKRLSTL